MVGVEDDGRDHQAEQDGADQGRQRSRRSAPGRTTWMPMTRWPML
jgi:hypothetical protein